MSEELIKTPCSFGDNDNFLLERELGVGGMGGVYMGRDKMLDRPVAVKVMLKEYGDDAEFVGKFKKEAQAAAKLIHPNIAQIYSYGICQGMPYIAMELATGGSLYSIMQNSGMKPDIQRVVKICQQTAQALQCASDQGFVHGDVKPENILLDANGNAKLVDFGLAAMQTDTDEIWGTPYYISPEKVKKEPIDFRADMYSLGGTLYHALTGVAPFEGTDSIEVVKQRFLGMPAKPSTLRPEVSEALDTLVMKMLALNKEDRYPSFEALLQAFNEVLTSGLVTTAGGSTSATVPAKKTAVTGTRRMTMRGRRMTTMRKMSAVKKAPVEGEENNNGDNLDDAKDLGEGEVPEVASKANENDEDEEKGGNLGVKIALFIVGGLAVIGALIGGLIWFKVASEKAEQEEVRQQIAVAFDKAKAAINDTIKKASEFADEFDAFAKKAIEACEKPTEELSKILPPEEAAGLKPPESKELLDAIAATNDAPKAVEAPATPPPAASAATNNAPTVTVKAATTNSPAAKATTATNAPAAKAVAKAPVKPTPVTKPTPSAEPSPAVTAMHELWERAYSCQASAVRIRHQCRLVIRKAKEADAITEVTRENMNKLAELSRTIVEMLDMAKGSKDVENVRKGITFIKSKGKTTYEQTVKRLRIEKLQADRKAKAEAAAAAEKAQEEAKAKEHSTLVESETKAAKDKFEAIVAAGSIRQLDWKNALRQLETMKADFKSAEGQLAAELEIRKVNDMKKLQEFLIKSLKNYTFKAKSKGKANVKGYKVSNVNNKEIDLVKADGKGKQRIMWTKFYKEYPGAFNELLNSFVIPARKNGKLGLKDWADTMSGAALTMQILFAEVNGATEKASSLLQEAVKEFPEYAKTAQAMFPNEKFDTSASED